MQEIFYQPKDAWVGDLIPYYENGEYYAFYLSDPRHEKQKYAEDTTWHLATTQDNFTFTEKGVAIGMGNENSPYRQCYTGSVIHGQDGLYYAFFTAFNKKFKENGKAVQTIMVAIGESLERLQVNEAFQLRADGTMYEPYDWRDPFVFYSEEDGKYLMLLCSRNCNSSARRGGCIALCSSDDLLTWKYEKPFFNPNLYIAMECPNVFRLGSFYYLSYSTFSDRFVTHYLISDNLHGPWRMPKEDSLDARADYAIKTTGDKSHQFAYGWVATKYGNNDYGAWEWAGTLICHGIKQDPKNGELCLVPTKPLLNAFKTPVFSSSEEMALEGEGLVGNLWDLPESTYMIEAILCSFPCKEMGLVLNSDDQMDHCYSLRFQNNTISWDMWPRTDNPGTEQWQIKGYESFQIETLRQLKKADEYHLIVIREGSIAVVYINDEVVLTHRLYRTKPIKMGVYVINGKVGIKDLRVMTI